ncbi:hypothetical protein OSTOST_08306, partial [Ostertagia ostertagi]
QFVLRKLCTTKFLPQSATSRVGLSRTPAFSVQPMDPINDARFYESLIKPPRQRTQDDIRNIYDQLRQLDMFSNLYNGPLKAICANARYERHAGHHVLYREGQVATCWYILLSGSVLIENNICLPYGW